LCQGLAEREGTFLAAFLNRAVTAGDGDVQGYSIN